MNRSQCRSESHCAAGFAKDSKDQETVNAQSNQFQSHESAVYLPCYDYDKDHAQAGNFSPLVINTGLVTASYGMPRSVILDRGYRPFQTAGDTLVKDDINLLDFPSSRKDTSAFEVEYDFNTPIRHEECGHTTDLGPSERRPDAWAFQKYRDLSNDALYCAPSGTISVTMGLVSQSVTGHNREILTATNCEKNTKFSHRDDVANHILTWLQHIPTASGLDQTQNREHESPEHNNTGSQSTIDGSDRDQTMMLHEDNGRISNRWLRFEEWTSLESSLASGHPFNALISSIILRALDGFTQWSVARNGWHNTRRDNDYQEREQASQSEVPFKKNGVLEFACPYYKKNPSRYAECLKRCRLKTVNDVKSHLWQNHRIPFYCPVCKREFSTASGRDQHIIKRLCALEDVFPFEGVSDDQRRQLFRRNKNFGERKQWFQIWKLLLPKEPTPRSAHLDATHGLEVSRFRDFWSLHGDMTISKAVKEANLADWDQRNEERDLACLYTEVLYGAIEKIMARLDII